MTELLSQWYSHCLNLHMWLDLWKSIQNWNPFYCLTLNLTLALPRNAKQRSIDGQVCFHRWPFAFPVRLPRWTIHAGPLEPVNGRLLPMTLSTYPVDWVCLCHLLKTKHCFLCPNGRYNPPLATHPPTYLPTPITCHQCYYTVAVKKVAQNPAVLAS